MSQIHFYVPDEVEELIRQRARARGLSVSRYVAELVKEGASGSSWPEDYFRDVIGAWKGEPLERPGQGEAEAREAL